MQPTLYYNLPLEEYQQKLDAAASDVDLARRIEAGVRDLQTKGYCVISDVIETELCDYAHRAFWEALEGASNGRLKQPQSAKDLDGFVRKGNWLPNLHGILLEPALAHLPCTHAIRTHPKIATFYARLYGASTGLIVAPDRVNYQMPAEWLPRAPFDEAWRADPDNLKRASEASWVHVDQALGKQGLHCIQGLAVLEDADQPGDASLEIIEGSHVQHEYLERILGLQLTPAQRRDDFYRFDDADKEELARRGFFDDYKVVRARKGSFIAWDSRAIHQGGRIRAHGTKAPRAIPRPRFVIYVCMQPAWEPLPSKVVARKTEIFTKLKTTSHWPLRNKIFGPPRLYGAAPPEFDFSRYVVRATDDDAQYPTLREFAGLAQQRTLRFGGPKLEEQGALLSFVPSSGMQQRRALKRFFITERETPAKRARYEI